MASTGTLALAAAAASAAVAFALVNIIGSAASPADLGDPVVVEPVSDATTSVPAPQTAPGTAVQPPDPESPEPRDDDDGDDDDDGGDD
ncbi:MAG: hypothetical protein ACRDZS_08730 [Acidimicrobiales bacterium]